MSLFDDISAIVGRELPAAGLAIDVQLVKVTRTRAPGQVTAPPIETTTTHAAKGFSASITSLQISGTLIGNANRIVKIYGSTIAGGAVPKPADRIVIPSEGITLTIVDDSGGLRAVTTDAARAVYTCQCT